VYDRDAEIRKAVASLVRLTKKFRVHAESCDSTLAIVMEAILKLPPEQRPSFRPGGLEAVRQTAREMAEERVSKSTVRLENALESDADWLIELQAYTSSLLRD
jgi:hypothetical protein